MAIPLRHLFPLQQVRQQRWELGRYVQMDASRGYIVAAIFLAILGLATIGQTVRVAQTGHEIDKLLREQIKLEREYKSMLLQIADAQSITRIETYATESGMIPVQDTEVYYMVLRSEQGRIVVSQQVEQTP
jgi:cell division protein FtsL